MLASIAFTCYLSIFLYLLFKHLFFTATQLPFKTLTLFFLLKVAFGIGFVYHYSADASNFKLLDTFKYYNDGETMFNVFKTSPLNYFRLLFGISDDLLAHYYNAIEGWSPKFNSSLVVNESHVITRMHAFFHLLSFSSIYTHLLFLNFISFAGLIALYRFFLAFIPKYKSLIFLSVFCIPSVLYWTSTQSKEALLLFLLGSIFLLVQKIAKGRTSFYSIIAIACLFFLLFLSKTYIAFIVFLILISFYIKNKFEIKMQLWKLYVLITFSLLILFTITLIPKWPVFDLLKQKRTDMMNVSRGGAYFWKQDSLFYISYADFKTKTQLINDSVYNINAGTQLEIFSPQKSNDRLSRVMGNEQNTFKLFSAVIPANTAISNNSDSFVKTMFFSLAGVFFNVGYTTQTIFLQLIVWIEGALIGLLVLTAILFRRKKQYPETKTVITFCLALFIPVFLILAYFVPIAGALLRFKAPFLIFLVLFLLLWMDTDKLTKIFKYKNE